jgi:hypothetical protein
VGAAKPAPRFYADVPAATTSATALCRRFHPDAELIPSQNVKPALILDTNVAIELTSRGDLWRAVDLSGGRFTEDVCERIFRAQCALALRLWLHRERVWTITCAREQIEISTSATYFAPNDDGRSTLQRLGGAEIALFVQNLDGFLPGWKFGDDGTAPKEIRGNALDSWYVDRAVAYGVPLLSNEGWIAGGKIEEKKSIRKKARAANVAISTTKEFLIERGVPIRDYADRCVTQMLRWLVKGGRPAPPARVYDLRQIARFRCPCSRPQRYGIYCCPERGFVPAKF